MASGAIFLMLLGGGWLYTDKIEQRLLNQQKAAIAQKEQEMLQKALDERVKYEKKLNSINSKYVALSNSLRSRPSRESSVAQPASSCTGRELYREDGEFLAREAARAQRVLEERNYYYEQYLAVKRKLEQND